VHLYLDTLRALASRRRSIPIAVVAAALLYTQRAGPGTTVAKSVWVLAPGVTMLATFLLLGPWAWRALFPLDRSLPYPLVRVTVFLAMAQLPSLLGTSVARALDLGTTFLTFDLHLPVNAALFVTGGWGLGRDIQMEQRSEHMAREVQRAQLLAIRAHLDPHFLFNTLNAIAEWTREDPQTAESAILRLSSLLREVLGGIRVAAWPLTTELGLARDLLELHRLRDPTWFTIDWRVPDPIEAHVPPLILLPLVENAVKHGPAQGYRGPIAISVERDRNGWTITVTNPGPCGLARPGAQGLATVRERLALAYGPAASLMLASATTPDGGPRTDATVATMHLPLTEPLGST